MKKHSNHNDLGLKPSDITHASSTDKSTTLHYKNGNRTTIAHNVLSPKMRQQLKALTPLAQQDATEGQTQESQDQHQYGKVIMKAEGGVMDTVSKAASAAADWLGGDTRAITKGEDESRARTQDSLRHANEAPSSGYAKGGKVKPAFDHMKMIADLAAAGHHDAAKACYEKYCSGGMAKYAQGTKDHPVSGDDADVQKYDDSNPSESIMDKASSEWNKLKSKGISGLTKASLDPEYGRSAKNPTPLRSDDQEVAQRQEQQGIEQASPDVQPPNGGMSQGAATSPMAPPAIETPGGLAAADQGAQGLDQAAAKSPGMPGFDSMVNQGYNAGMQASKYGQEAGIMKSQADQEALQNNVWADQSAIKAYQSGNEEINQERQNHINDIQNGYIDPNKYWTGYDVNIGGGKTEHVAGHSKIAAAIGMIIAGFNPTNRPNAAIELLKNQMDMSMSAQAKNLDSQNNLLRANLEHFRNFKDATAMTKLMMADTLNHQLGLAAAQAATPQAKAAAQAAQSQLAHDYAPLAMQVTMSKALGQLYSGDQNQDAQSIGAMIGHLRAMPNGAGMQQAGELEAHYIPGVGMSKIAMPVEARNQLTAHQDLSNALADLRQFTKSHTTLVPETADYTVGAQKAMIIQTMLRHGLLNTVYREGEQPLLDKLVKGNPANFLKEFNTLPQIKELMRNNDAQEGTLRNQYGLPARQQSSNGMVSVMSPDGKAGQVPKDKLAQALKLGYKAK